MNEANHFKNVTNPYVRDVFLSYLIPGAKRTEPDGYPIIERWMVADEPPEEMIQWDCRREVKEPKNTAMSFYCKDEGFTPILNNPARYIEKLAQYACIIGMDASPYDNMPLAVQKSQIYTNLAITYYYGSQGLKVIPNVRLGNNETIGMLDAIPHNCLIAVGTNGFMKLKANRALFAEQMDIVIDMLHPSGVLVYGPIYESVLKKTVESRIPIYQYDSHTMKRNEALKAENARGGVEA